MSKATKRKHVTKEAVDDYYVPEGDEEIVKISASRGNNLHEVENAHGKHFLVSMPTKFRKNIWVKRGDYVVMVPIKEGNKVQGEIVYILLAKQIKYLKDENLWPKEYTSVEEKEEQPFNNADDKVEPKEIKTNDYHYDCSDSDSETTDDELFENPNHRPICYADSSEDSSEDEDEDGDDENEDEEEEEEEESASVTDKCDANGLEDAVARVKLK